MARRGCRYKMIPLPPTCAQRLLRQPPTSTRGCRGSLVYLAAPAASNFNCSSGLRLALCLQGPAGVALAAPITCCSRGSHHLLPLLLPPRTVATPDSLPLQPPSGTAPAASAPHCSSGRCLALAPLLRHLTQAALAANVLSSRSIHPTLLLQPSLRTAAAVCCAQASPEATGSGCFRRLDPALL